MSGLRFIAPFIIAASLASCAARPPKPSMVRRTVPDNRNWLSAAINIQHPSSFEKWEPIAEEISGNAPVSYKNVFFVPNARLATECGMRTTFGGGCYKPMPVFTPNRIFIGESAFGLPGCEEQSISRFATWVHEQGHHFDRYLGSTPSDRLLNEVEANAFELYFAEHIYRNYSRLLGLLLIRWHSERIELFPDGRRNKDFLASFSNLMGRLLAENQKKADPDSEMFGLSGSRLARFSYYSIRGKPGNSAGAAWYLIHASSHDRLLRMIIDTPENGLSGIEKSTCPDGGCRPSRAEPCNAR